MLKGIFEYVADGWVFIMFICVVCGAVITVPIWGTLWCLGWVANKTGIAARARSWD